MLQLVLAVALGFAAALFMVMLAGPAIARRISALTWRQAEASLPMTMTEIAADRDRLRAEHAMDKRQLEMKLEASEEGWRAERLISVRQADTIAALEAKAAEREAEIATLEAQLAALNEEKARLDVAAVDAHARELALESDLLETRTALKTARQTIDGLRVDLSNADIERVALETKYDQLSDAHKALSEREKDLKAERADLRSRAKTAEADARLATGKAASFEKKLEQAARRMADLEDRIERLKPGKPETAAKVRDAAPAAKRTDFAASLVPSAAVAAPKREQSFKPETPTPSRSEPESAVVESPSRPEAVDPMERFNGLRQKIERVSKAGPKARAKLREDLMDPTAEFVVHAAETAGNGSQLATALGEAQASDGGLSGRIAQARDRKSGRKA